MATLPSSSVVFNPNIRFRLSPVPASVSGNRASFMERQIPRNICFLCREIEILRRRRTNRFRCLTVGGNGGDDDEKADQASSAATAMEEDSKGTSSSDDSLKTEQTPPHASFSNKVLSKLISLPSSIDTIICRLEKSTRALVATSTGFRGLQLTVFGISYVENAWLYPDLLLLLLQRVSGGNAVIVGVGCSTRMVIGCLELCKVLWLLTCCLELAHGYQELRQNQCGAREGEHFQLLGAGMGGVLAPSGITSKEPVYNSFQVDSFKLMELLGPEKVDPLDVKLIKDKLFGYSTFWVTKEEPFGDLGEGILFLGNLRGKREEVFAKLQRQLHEITGNKYNLFMVEEPNSEGPDPRGGPRVSFGLLRKEVSEPGPTTLWQYVIALLLFVLTTGSCVELGIASQLNRLPPEVVKYFTDPDATEPPDMQLLFPFVETALPLAYGVLGIQLFHGSGSTAIRPRVVLHHLHNLKGSGSEAICPRVVIHHLHNLKGSGSEAIRPRST
ncbi:putative zinc metalloprotease egy1, chloroplastic [Asimina triloba]